MSAAVPIIDAVDLTKVYNAGTAGEVLALRGVDLRVERGEFLAIMGASGSGKSTMMNLLGCLDTPTAGSYRLDGVDVGGLDATGLARLRLEKLGFVFQGFHLLSRQSALENVMMPLAYAGVPVHEREPRALAALAEVGLAERARHKPNELSGGQQQRVAIARALINEPALILADEPTGALDSRTSEEIMALFERLQASGRTVVIITHERPVAEHADRIVVMHDGELHPDGWVPQHAEATA
ncbi:ABC transporter ATP-binding protein [Arenimonas composti]|uniref:ABC transporter n=1 Tax=Arenimonas composti TR7-09 = DSM 18010 TaxID=1121013 RepID=A0A091BBW3_9GAMM|nr:ABC transporter ATP-binding protein [Arenimonas composti]KFN49251.1 ABC transporter [Arenimonas composti TR7-09 = DSM 18010]